MNADVHDPPDGFGGGTGSTLTVPNTGDYADGILMPGEYVDVHFVLCLHTFEDFTFHVDVQEAPELEKVITDGPDLDGGFDVGDGNIDLVVEVGQDVSTEYTFEINYANPGGPDVVILDTVPAEWTIKKVDNEVADDIEVLNGWGSGSDDNGGSVDVFPANKKINNKSATKIEWRPDAAFDNSSITIVVCTRGRPARHPKRWAPTSCGSLHINDGAEAFELDSTGEPVRDPITDEILPQFSCQIHYALRLFQI